MKSSVFFLILMVWPLAVPANPALVARQDFHTLRIQAGTWLEKQAQKAYPDTLVQVRVGQVDERLNLPACPEPRFFLPGGAIPWGNGSMGARCEGAVKWSLYLTFESRLRGPALVAVHPMPVRHVPGRGDLELKLLDYRHAPDRYPRELPAGAQLLRPMAAGQPLLLDALRQPDVIRAGQKVQVTATGSGFHVGQAGTALGNAAEGDLVKIKTASGRIVQGIATKEGEVAVTP